MKNGLNTQSPWFQSGKIAKFRHCQSMLNTSIDRSSNIPCSKSYTHCAQVNGRRLSDGINAAWTTDRYVTGLKQCFARCMWSVYVPYRTHATCRPRLRFLTLHLPLTKWPNDWPRKSLHRRSYAWPYIHSSMRGSVTSIQQWSFRFHSVVDLYACTAIFAL